MVIEEGSGIVELSSGVAEVGFSVSVVGWGVGLISVSFVPSVRANWPLNEQTNKHMGSVKTFKIIMSLVKSEIFTPKGLLFALYGTAQTQVDSRK